MRQKVYIGRMPPPLGGISIYLYRLSKIEKDAKFVTKNISGYSLILSLLPFLFCEKEIIYNAPSIKSLSILYLFCKVTRNIYTVVSHGSYLSDLLLTDKKERVLKIAKGAHKLQFVNPDHAAKIIEEGIGKEKIIIRNAFLPPPLEDEGKILKSYPKELFEFIDSHSPLLMANASSLVFYQGVDLYGLDMCVQLTDGLKKHYPDIGFIFALADEKANPSYLTEIKKEITRLKLDQNFYFLTGQKEMWPLFKRVDLFIRPTNRDGYGISIDESLEFNCPAIASDACKRHPNAVIFENRNANDLLDKALILCKNKSK